MIDNQKAESERQQEILEKHFFLLAMHVCHHWAAVIDIGLVGLIRSHILFSFLFFYEILFSLMKFSFIKCLFVLPDQLPFVHLIIQV